MALIFFFVILIPYIMAMTAPGNNAAGDYLRDLGVIGPLSHSERIMQITENYLGFGHIAGIVIFASAAIAAIEFVYLHNRSETDFFHGLPQSRSEIFRGRFIAGILVFAVPYLIMTVIAAVYGIVSGVPAESMAGIVFPAFGINIVYYSLHYALFVLAMMLTGKLFVGILGMLTLDFIYPMAILVLGVYFHVENLTNLFGPGGFLINLSPTVASLTISGRVYSGEEISPGWGAPVWTAVLMTVLYAALALFLYKKRPLESAGNAMAFKKSEPVIRIPLVILSGLSMGLIFGQGNGWMLFGILVGMVVTHCIMEIIFNMDFKKLFSNKMQLAICMATGIFAFFASAGNF